ncbi:zinc finger protein ubi-d4 [Clonorchis sinensis]|uniref:Zinc finger protein ubi-d4 n=1 Tax=Clonorchis sinensis TaxID=79923 RepID=G7YXR5_CLOSI|nr:zinc finger protein ubi-d4 [Clonorchis sinensis]
MEPPNVIGHLTLIISAVVTQVATDTSLKDVEDEDSRSTWAAGPDYDIDSDASDFLDETYGSRRRRKKLRVIGFLCFTLQLANMTFSFFKHMSSCQQTSCHHLSIFVHHRRME